jgi:3-oxoacyl-[acyl-carrier protein] reductase
LAERKGELANRVALITGASRGIGAACAVVMAREGADVVINYLHSEAEAETVAAQVRALGQRALVVRADVSDQPQVLSMLEQATEAFGRVDILVSNAGRHPTSVRSIEDMTLEEWEATQSLNLTAHLICFRALVTGMMERGWGRIINLGSFVAQRGTLSGNPFYVICKAGVHGLTLAVFRRVAPLNITVNTVSPGTIDTDQTRQLLSAEQMQARAKDAPIGRLGRPGEVAEVIAFLASPRASLITGQLISVNGGQYV